jgi:hypothetical protein
MPESTEALPATLGDCVSVTSSFLSVLCVE